MREKKEKMKNLKLKKKEIQKKEMAKKDDGSYARLPSSLIANRVQGSSCCEGLKIEPLLLDDQFQKSSPLTRGRIGV
jgi:hypothetical protein